MRRELSVEAVCFFSFYVWAIRAGHQPKEQSIQLRTLKHIGNQAAVIKYLKIFHYILCRIRELSIVVKYLAVLQSDSVLKLLLLYE